MEGKGKAATEGVQEGHSVITFLKIGLNVINV
jgi:hypothetical protein